MIVYASLFLLILIPLIRYDICGKKGYEDIWYYVLLSALTAVAAFRYRTGGDTIIYMNFFDEYPTISELRFFDFTTAEFNPMWYIYNSVFKTLGNSFLLFQIVQAIFVNSVIFWYLRKYCHYFFISVLVYYLGYYFYYNMEIQREILCICLFLLVYPALIEKKYVRYYATVIFAITIHISAVLLLFMPLFIKLKNERIWLSLGTGLITVVFLLKFNVVDIVLSSILGDGSNIAKRYLMLEAPNAVGMIVTFMTCIPFLLFSYARKRMNIVYNNEMGALLNMVVLIQCVGMCMQGPARFSNYLMLIGLVFIVNTTFDNIDKIRQSQISKMVVLCGWFIYIFNLSYFYLKNKNEDVQGIHVYDRYIPYVSVFNPHLVEKRERLMINERYERSFPLHREP